MNTNVFSELESEVRSYCRAFPVVFNKAKGSCIYSEEGKRYIDFFAGAGTLNYGHNHDYIKTKLIEYMMDDSIMHGLDMYTCAKRQFIQTFNEKILKPRNLSYKIQFGGPTGTNAVEAALKLARKAKRRSGIIAFQGGFHGMTSGALSVTGNKYNRNGAGVPLDNDVTFMPYPYGYMATFNTIEYMEQVLSDPNSGVDIPAAVIVETIQAEGGVIVAPTEWLRSLRQLCNKYDIALIVDDIQVGCGRIGSFFSFERAQIEPDIILLSKSLSGYGLPLSMVLMKPELDVWSPGEHNGTFRGNQLAFVGGTAAIDLWIREEVSSKVAAREKLIREYLNEKIAILSKDISIRGMGMIWGIDLSSMGSEVVEQILAGCFEKGLIVENAGRRGCVIKLLPPLNIPLELLREGLDILHNELANKMEAKIAI